MVVTRYLNKALPEKKSQEYFSLYHIQDITLNTDYFSPMIYIKLAFLTLTIVHQQNKFKGTVSRDFLLLVFFMNQFPPAPEYPTRTVSNFFENSRRY
jgi:hypothetical protein